MTHSAAGLMGAKALLSRMVRHVVTFSAVLALSACASVVEYSADLELSKQDAGVELDGLDAAAETFFGGPVPIDDGQSPFSGTGSITSQPVDRVQSSALIARVRAKRPLTETVALLGEVSISDGSGRYSLPDGTEVLTDPAQVSFSSNTLNAAIGLSRAHQHPVGVSSEVFGGVGYRVSRTNRAAGDRDEFH